MALLRAYLLIWNHWTSASNYNYFLLVYLAIHDLVSNLFSHCASFQEYILTVNMQVSYCVFLFHVMQSSTACHWHVCHRIFCILCITCSVRVSLYWHMKVKVSTCITPLIPLLPHTLSLRPLSMDDYQYLRYQLQIFQILWTGDCSKCKYI